MNLGQIHERASVRDFIHLSFGFKATEASIKIIAKPNIISFFYRHFLVGGGVWFAKDPEKIEIKSNKVSVNADVFKLSLVIVVI